MYLYNLEGNNYKKMVENNKMIMIGIYQKNCVVSDLFIGCINKVNELTNKNVVVCLIEKEEYLKNNEKNEKQIFPTLLVFNNSKIIKKIYGFCCYSFILNELKKLKY